MVWWGVVWWGVVWWSVVWCGGVWCGMVWCGVVTDLSTLPHRLLGPGFLSGDGRQLLPQLVVLSLQTLIYMLSSPRREKNEETVN